MTTRSRSNGAALKRYYWKVVIPAWCEFCGDDPRPMHHELATYLLPDVDDDGREIRTSITALSPRELSHYVDDCKRLLATFAGIYIPDPEER